MSKKVRDMFGFGNTELEEKFKKFAPLNQDLSGLTIAITGGNSGIGLAAAKKLSAMGARVLILARESGKAEAALAEIGGRSEFLRVDMTDFKSIHDLKLPPVDVLIHNAGFMFDTLDQVQWPSGSIERTFALMCVGPYLLSKIAQAKYTIWVSSGGMYTKKLNVDETLNPPGKFDGMTQYALCKRAQVVLARRLGHQSMHPGWVDTPAVRVCMPSFYQKNHDILRTPDQGADTIVWLAATRPAPLGFYFDRERVDEYKVPFTTHKEAEEIKLLAELERLTMVDNK